MLKEWVHAMVWLWRHKRSRHCVPEFAAAVAHVRSTDTCLDVGAHGGSWTLPLARKVPQGRVYGFEALPYYAAVLKKLIFLSRLKNVTIVNCAVAAGCD